VGKKEKGGGKNKKEKKRNHCDEALEKEFNL
jgi:hypothetical protein